MTYESATARAETQAETYANHVATLTSKYEQILAAGQSVLIHSGSEQHYFGDDRGIVFQAFGHFAHWLPVNRPDHFVLVKAGDKPRYFQVVPQDFWYDQSLQNDLARALAVGAVRIEAPIPGKNTVGLEVPNPKRELVRLSEAVLSPAFQNAKALLPLVLGKSIEGEIWVKDLAKMPHLLIAGSTGSGKSVAINVLLHSLLFKHLPTTLRLLLIDPKMVELTPYEGIPHLAHQAVAPFHVGARNLEQYNAKVGPEEALPYLVIVVDELADLMMTAPKEVEAAILRLAQMARATGMHLILATQRPSVDILTSLIKVNIPARLAFAVSSGFDSRTILDAQGAERLIGQGDALFHQPGLPKPVRLQVPYVSEEEVARVAGFLRGQSYEDRFAEAYGADFEPPKAVEGGGPGEVDFSDPLLKKAAEIVVEEGYGSVSRLQRRLSIGHARAGKLMDALEAMGIVGPPRGSKPREVLVTKDQLKDFFG